MGILWGIMLKIEIDRILSNKLFFTIFFPNFQKILNKIKYMKRGLPCGDPAKSAAALCIELKPKKCLN